ncbi:MAG: hypothetical protein Q9159_002992 [Coniocarpon cinnabarinum]
MAEDSDLRRRTAAKYDDDDQCNKQGSKQKSSARPASEASASSFGVLDGLRLLTALLLVSTVASYLTTRGQSFIWNARRPWWTKTKMLRAYFAEDLLLTNEQLKAYDGTDPSRPILLALNRTIYDVSASPHVYGPNGMYSQLAAKDASRSYITTCFDPANDLVPYLGGVEEIYVPLWLSKKLQNKEEAKDLAPELDAVAEGEVMEGMGMRALIDELQRKIGRRTSRLMREEAYEKARERVRAQIKTWEGMFNKKEYPIVGRVVGVNETDERLWRNLTFCEAALKQRPPLVESLSEAMRVMGSKDGKVGLDMMQRKDGRKGMTDDLPKKGRDKVERREEKIKGASLEEKDGGKGATE